MKFFLTRLFKKMSTDDCVGLSSEMAYTLILALVPILICLVSILGLMGGQQALFPVMADFIYRMAPVHTSDILIVALKAIIEGSSKGLTLVGFGGSLLSCIGTGSVIIKGLQRIYNISDHRYPMWYMPLLSIGIVFSLGISLLLATQVIGMGTAFIDWIYQYSHFYKDTVVALKMLRWVVITLDIWFVTTFTYALILRPKVHHLAWKKTCIGAFIFVGCWMLGSLIFSLYVERMHQFNPVYGTLGALMILITWLYFSSLMFLMGAEITALHILREEVR